MSLRMVNYMSLVARKKAAGGAASPPLTGLALWLDADNSGDVLNATGPDTQATNGQTVLQWKDRSGNGHTFDQSTEANKPTFQTSVLNGKPCVRFDGTVDALLGSSSVLGLFRNVAYGAIYVVTTPNGGDATREIFSVERGGGGTTGRAILYRTSAEAKWIAGGRRTDADSFVGVTAGSVDSDSAMIAGVLLDWGNSDLFLRVDGVQVASTTSFHVDGNTSDTDSGAIAIGANAHNPDANNYGGDVHEILCYNQSLSAQDISDIESYLANKWGISI